MGKFNFKPFDKVLVRDNGISKWIPQLFSYYYGMEEYPYGVISGMQYKRCVPYEGNEHLAGTTDDYVVREESTDIKYQRGDILTTTRGIIFLFSGRHTISKGRLRLGAIAKIQRKYNKVEIFEKGDWQYASSYELRFIRKSTVEEKEYFLSNLHEIGKDWNESLKDFVPCIPRDIEPGTILHQAYCLPTGQRYFHLYLFNGSFDSNGIPKYAAVYDSSDEDFYFPAEGGDPIPVTIKAEGYTSNFAGNLRVASETSEELFMDMLGREGLEWDYDLMKAVPHWQQGDTIFFVNASGEILSRKYAEASFFKELVKIGNAFRNAEDAKPYAEKIKKVFEEKR